MMSMKKLNTITSNVIRDSSTRDILLIEDNPADVRLIQEVLKDEKSKDKLNIAVDGTEALNYLHTHCEHKNQHCPDLIILDLNLPKKNGFEFLKDIKNNINLDKIPVIIFTTSNLEENKLKSLKMGVKAYITKPIDFDGYKKIIPILKKCKGTIYKN